MAKKKSTKIEPNVENKRGALSRMSSVKIQGNKEVPIVLRAIFSHYDNDDSGCISKSEMYTLVQDLQSILPGTPAHLKHCSEMVTNIALKALDLDNNGTVDEDEFVEWCQTNLFLSATDRQTLLIQNLDMSQFITALEICIKMQLVGIGPYLYYTPPPPTFKQKYCVTYKHFFGWCCLCFLLFFCVFIPICIYVIYPWAQDEGYISIDIKKVPRTQELNITRIR